MAINPQLKTKGEDPRQKWVCPRCKRSLHSLQEKMNCPRCNIDMKLYDAGGKSQEGGEEEKKGKKESCLVS
jgi:transposase-like protein